jgi:hypothetical protein
MMMMMTMMFAGESQTWWYSHSIVASTVDGEMPQSHLGAFASMPPFPDAA